MQPQPPPLTHTHKRGLSQIRRHTESAYRGENRFKEMDCACVRPIWEYVWKCVSVFCVQVRKRHTLNKMLTKGFFELLHMAHTQTNTQIYYVCVYVQCMCILVVKFGKPNKKRLKILKTSSYLLYLSAKKALATLIFGWPNNFCCPFVRSDCPCCCCCCCCCPSSPIVVGANVCCRCCPHLCCHTLS